MFSMILAMDQDKLVGDSNGRFGIPWHYPEDMKFYRETTTGKKNIMGRVTFDLIGRPLPNRETYVLTRNKDLTIEGATVVNDPSIIKEMKGDYGSGVIIGGVDIFEMFKDDIDRIYLTIIKESHTGDCYYDNFNTNGFKLVDSRIGEDQRLVFETWDRC